MSSASIIKEKDVRTLLSIPPQLKTADETKDLLESDLSLKARLAQFEKTILLRGFEEESGNVSRLARKLKIDRANLHRKLKDYGIK